MCRIVYIQWSFHRRLRVSLSIERYSQLAHLLSNQSPSQFAHYSISVSSHLNLTSIQICQALKLIMQTWNYLTLSKSRNFFYARKYRETFYTSSALVIVMLPRVGFMLGMVYLFLKMVICTYIYNEVAMQLQLEYSNFECKLTRPEFHVGFKVSTSSSKPEQAQSKVHL